MLYICLLYLLTFICYLHDIIKGNIKRRLFKSFFQDVIDDMDDDDDNDDDDGSDDEDDNVCSQINTEQAKANVKNKLLSLMQVHLMLLVAPGRCDNELLI